MISLALVSVMVIILCQFWAYCIATRLVTPWLTSTVQYTCTVTRLNLTPLYRTGCAPVDPRRRSAS